MVYLGLKQYHADNVWKTGVVFVFFLIASILVHAQGPILFEEDFENGQGDFLIIDSSNNLWHLSAACQVPEPGHSQGAAFRYGRENNCDYDDGESQGVIESPYIDLTSYVTGPIELRFKYYLETESSNCSFEADIAIVKISENRGPYVAIAHNCPDPKSDLVPLDNPTPAWTESIVDISEYAGSLVQFQFSFDTGDGTRNDYKGFYVDDIVVYGPPCEFVIAGDINKDCVVNLVDFAAMAENWLLNCYLTPSDPGCVPE